MIEPWQVSPGGEILATLANVSRWPYSKWSSGGKDWFPAPVRPGIPAATTFGDVAGEPQLPDGITCSSLTALLLATAYPKAKWTSQDDVPKAEENTTTYARITGWRMSAHLAAGGVVATASNEVLWDALDAVHEVGVAWAPTMWRQGEGDNMVLGNVLRGSWCLVQGWWNGTRGHAFLLYRFDGKVWLMVESNGTGPRRLWKTTSQLVNAFPEALGVAVLRPPLRWDG